MKIVAMHARNFAGLSNHPNEESWPIGTVTRLRGANGVSKTSFLRAIAWALTGLKPDCTQAAGYVRANDETTSVKLFLRDADGTELELARKRTKTASTTTFDGLPQTDAQLARRFNIDPLAMMVMLWPGAFFELAPAKRSELLHAITPDPDYKRLFHEATGLDVDIDWSQSAKNLQTQWGTKRLAIEKEGAKLGGQIDELKRSLNASKEGSMGDPKAIQTQIDAITAEMNELKKDENALAENSRAWDRYQVSLAAWEDDCLKIDKANSATDCPTCKRPWADAPKRKKLPEPVKPTAPKGDVAALSDVRGRISELWEQVREQTPLLKLAEQQASMGKDSEERLGRLEATRKLLMEDYRTTKRIEDALHPQKGIWGKALEEKLSRLSLPGFKFDTTGGKVSISRESDGLPVDDMSSGERIKFCVQLSGMIASLTTPAVRALLLEHMDLVDSVPPQKGFQLIAERVDKSCQALCVEVVRD